MCVWSRPSRLLRVDECGHPCTSTRHCCFTPSWPWLLKSPRPFLWDCGKGCDRDFSFVASTSQSFIHIIYVIWSVASLNVFHCTKKLLWDLRASVYRPETTFLPWFGQLQYLADILTTSMFFAMAPYTLIFIASHFSSYAGGLFWRVPGERTYLEYFSLGTQPPVLSMCSPPMPCPDVFPINWVQLHAWKLKTPEVFVG